MEILKRFFRRRIRAIKWWIGLTLGAGSLLAWWLISIDRGPVEVPVTLSSQLFPLVDVDIGKTRLPCMLKLTSKYPLYIAEEHLADLPKSPRGEGSWKNVQGQESKAPLFSVSSVSLNKFKLGRMLTAPQSPFSDVMQGSITWPFHKLNALIDLPRRTVWGVQHIEALPSIGFDPAVMEKVPCTISSKGVFFASRSSDGELFNTCIATACNLNIINSSLLNSEIGDEPFIEHQLKIGNRDFGTTILRPYELTPEMGADIILGIEFLQKHVVYIDAAQEFLYIGEMHATALSGPSVVKLPVEYTRDGRPVVEIELEQQKTPVLFDLASDAELDLPSSMPCAARLRQLYSASKVNCRGDETEAVCCLLPTCRLGGIELNNLITRLGPRTNCRTKIKLAAKKGSTSYVGTLGRPLLHRTNMYIDLPNSLIWLVNRQADLKQIGLELENYQQIPFEEVPLGIVCSFNTDLGCLRFVLDTGAGGSVIKPGLIPQDRLVADEIGNQCTVSDTFVLGDYDYGQQKLYPLEISPRLEGFDGILGTDFFPQHAFFIDYPNRVIYFQKPDSYVLARDD